MRSVPVGVIAVQLQGTVMDVWGEFEEEINGHPQQRRRPRILLRHLRCRFQMQGGLKHPLFAFCGSVGTGGVQQWQGADYTGGVQAVGTLQPEQERKAAGV
mgnify:FL=1